MVNGIIPSPHNRNEIRKLFLLKTYVLELWFEKRVKPVCRGAAYSVRFVDGTPVQARNRKGVSPLPSIVPSEG
jgi:hypothetical protein